MAADPLLFGTSVAAIDSELTAEGLTFKNATYELKLGYSPSTIHLAWAVVWDPNNNTAPMIHTGVLVTGNTYQITSKQGGNIEVFDEKSWLLVHRMPSGILFEASNTKESLVTKLASSIVANRKVCKQGFIECGKSWSLPSELVETMNAEIGKNFSMSATPTGATSNCMCFSLNMIKVMACKLPNLISSLEVLDGLPTAKLTDFKATWKRYKEDLSGAMDDVSLLSEMLGSVTVSDD
jgi:hypothetical protein